MRPDVLYLSSAVVSRTKCLIAPQEVLVSIQGDLGSHALAAVYGQDVVVVASTRCLTARPLSFGISMFLRLEVK
jgi:hypothetical protein